MKFLAQCLPFRPILCGVRVRLPGTNPIQYHFLKH